MTQQSHCWAYTPRKPELKETHVPQCSLQHCMYQPGHGSNLDVHQQMNGQESCGTYTQWSIQFSSVAQSCPTLCDPMNRSTPGLPVYHQLLEFHVLAIVNSAVMNIVVDVFLSILVSSVKSSNSNTNY